MVMSTIVPALPSTRRRSAAGSRGRGSAAVRPIPIPIPIPALPCPTAREAEYGLATLDQYGRLADRTVLRALHWGPGHPLALTLVSGSVLVIAHDDGTARVGNDEYLRLPVGVRRACRLVPGDRVLLVADPPSGQLFLHPPAAFGSTQCVNDGVSASGLRVAECAGTAARDTGEELPEVRRFGEAESTADGGDGQVGVGQQSLGLQRDPGVDEVLGGVAGGSLAGSVERLEGVAEPGGVVLGLPQHREGTFQLVPEEPERLVRGAGGRAVGGGQAGDAQQDASEQLAHQLPGDLRLDDGGVLGCQVSERAAEPTVVVGVELPGSGAEGVVGHLHGGGEMRGEVRSEQDDERVELGMTGCAG